MIINTPKPPYFAVIFTSERKNNDPEYVDMNDMLEQAALDIDGFLGTESAREYDANGSNLGISISYWRDEQAINTWRNHAKHKIAKGRGINDWYNAYSIRITEVKSDNIFST